ncbi:VOC family protein [Photobacterium sp. SDRW27]|uniref:VOC family protein n=1 Tax=Photobacterium obscurum TaxID=2829490 RepID=UPI002244299F|nr:VOC family protein [Photobacterium obscurum]MCW8329062.1 VOC family protein [Photobacterium obscurum]
MLNNPIGWFEIYVDNLMRAKCFYEAVLGVNLEHMDNPANPSIDMWGFPSNMEQYGATGALVKMERDSARRNSTIVYFSCEDCGIEESRVVTVGGNIQQSKKSIGQYGFMSLVIDTEGNMFGLHSMK